MNAWIPFYNAQMANNLMKWWRTKFLSGYKQFSVDCNEGLLSDTEELLGCNKNNEHVDNMRATCTTPPYQIPNIAPENKPTQHLNLEQFSCDVSVEGGHEKNGQERQEFSFTLYDFDGHGKITKDDIAGLVTTIYEVLGSSVKVPHYGSKTISVKLTVSPDQRKHVQATVIDKKQPKKQSQRKTKSKCKKSKRDENRHPCCHHADEEIFSDEDSSEVCSRVSGCLTCAEDEAEDRCSSIGCEKKKPVPKYTIPNVFLKEKALPETKVRKMKKRSSSVQRQELLKIIQANMDKNTRFQAAEKPCENRVNMDIKSSQLVRDRQPRLRRRPQKLPPIKCLTNLVDPTKFYVDLAALQNTTRLPMSSYQYNKLINAVMCVQSSQPAAQTSPRIMDQKKRIPQVAVGHTSSPHHLRHRNRQEDQARAMRQVVHWLEQEFTPNGREEKCKSSSRSSGEEKERSGPGVERHEHHHVHEHIHHHYHHYEEETPIVV